MRERGPVMYVLAMVLAIFGIKTLSTGSSPESSAARGEKIDARSKEPEPGSAGSKARPLTGEFWHPLRDFWYAQLPDKKGDGETKEPWPGFPAIPRYSFEFLIPQVPHPPDSR